jgi:hypothetical protein
MRHRWNEEFSRYMDSLENPPTLAEQEQMRNYLQGWKPGSGTAAAYNERNIQRKAMEAGQKLQEGMMRIPERLKDETRGRRYHPLSSVRELDRTTCATERSEVRWSFAWWVQN